MEERLLRRPTVRRVLSLKAFEKWVGPGPEEPLWKLRRTPPVAPRRELEGARLGSIKPRPRRGPVAGRMEERLSRRPVTRSVVYRRAFEGLAFITRSCGGRGLFGVPATLREQGRQWHATSVATAPECQSRTLQWGKHGRLAFGGRP
ncbi:hypothetical protein Esi_0172_0039 [Ectocarpus siliculosus]|uniref:Uncharacterized protein n=1 Tax=Ectocarpus siliculosus TaxID=2880 RepID=D7FMZ2_ECTSI|nr:hypothetical protein Esi_0172_0039 [Ectocarpus siliculosus]|eukprot:CBJ30056.1 hypothetical protein Esi_0172_0039 [Ectocarpus siliculosus]